MHLTKAFVSIMAFALATTIFSQAQVQSPSGPLTIAGESFRVGMPRFEATERLERCCRTDGSAEALFIRPKNDDSIIGAIFFQDDRVVGLRLYQLQSRDRQVADFVQTLYRVLNENAASSRNPIAVSLRQTEGANFSGHELQFDYADSRIVRLEESRLDDGSVVVNLYDER